MRIGVLINDLNHLLDWELRVIERMTEHPILKLDLLILDGRKVDKHQSKLTLGRFLLKIQTIMERKFFGIVDISNKEKIIDSLNKINRIFINPIRRGVIDLIRDGDAKNIKKHKLDLIIKLGFDIIVGQVTGLSKHGIWALFHSEESMNPIDVAGFWETTSKHSIVCVSLEQLTDKAETAYIIDKAFFNPYSSFARTNAHILEASISILFKHINKLISADSVSDLSIHNHSLNYKYPGFWHVLKYLFAFYIKAINELLSILDYRLFGTRYECWTLFLGEGELSDSTLANVKAISPPKNEYWADPFIYNYKNNTYILFENFSYSSKKAKISCGRLENNDLVDITDVLDLDYHLSFPNIFEVDNEIYLMPETGDNKRLEVYRCISFPDKWELYTTAFEGEVVKDPVFYTDEHGQRWLFISKSSGVNSTLDNELHIYQVDSIKLNKLKSHAQNPVIIDARTARNAGAIFNREGKIYRPSQANIDGIYGRALNMNTIDKLTLDDYQETRITTVYPDFRKGLMSMHHFHQLNHLFVIDAAYKRK